MSRGKMLSLAAATLGLVITTACAGESAHQTSGTVGRSAVPPIASAPATPSSRGMDFPPPEPHDGPCAGRKLDATDARLLGSLPTRRLVPRSTRVSTSTLTEIWDCDPTFIAKFEGGFTVMTERWSRGVDGATYWQDFLDDNPGGSLSRVHGVIGETEEPNDADRPGLVQFFLDGWLVVVSGNHKTSTQELVRIANTL